MTGAAITAEHIAASRVLVVGDSMLDRYWFGEVERISPEAPVPVVRVTREEHRLGGAANVALNAATLGAGATLVSVVGEDEAAGTLRRLLAASGIAPLLGHDPQLRTTVKLRVIGRSQQLIRVDFENTPDHEVLAGMLGDYAGALPTHSAVLFSDYGKGGLAHIPAMIARARAAGRPVIVDPKGADYARYAGASVLTPNRSELAQVVGHWTDEADLTARAQALRARLGVETLMLTRSEEGMSLYDAEGETHVAAQAREVFDVTGAGDTVAATLGVLMGAGLSARAAMPIANRAGGLVVGKFGTASLTFGELFG